MRETRSNKSLSETIRRLFRLGLQVYLVFLASLTVFQRSLIYHPNRCDRLLGKDSLLSQSVVDVVVRTTDGLDLNGWLMLTDNRPGSDPIDLATVLATDRPVILYFPGNARDRSMRNLPFEAMCSLGANMLLVDYRGYADNPGKPSEASFVRDARSVWNHLTTELQVSPNRIVIYGESLGGGVATRLTSDLCREGIEPGGLILQSTFSSLVDVAAERFPWIPVSLLLADQFSSAQHITHVTCPILQVHGQQDSIVSFAIGQKLYDAAPMQSSQGIPKRQIVLAQTDHNDVYYSNRDLDGVLLSGLRDFLQLNKDLQHPAAVSERVALTTKSPSRVNWNPFNWIDGTITRSILLLGLAALVWWLSQPKK